MIIRTPGEIRGTQSTLRLDELNSKAFKLVSYALVVLAGSFAANLFVL